MHGADTDRGRIYIRYGPPDITAALAPGIVADANDVVTYWLYKSGFMFSFSGMATYGTSHTPLNDRALVDGMETAQPVRWDNIASFRVDSMPVQTARFRGGRDSVDVMVAATPPFTTITEASAVKESVKNSFWLLRGGTVAVAYDTAVLAAPGSRFWTKRVAPGQYVYRIEASAPTSNRAGRATAELMADADPRSGFLTHGFGLSDILFASSTEPGAAGGPWTSFRATPIVGAVPHDTPVSVVWENYEFGQKDGTAQYSVAIAIVRDRSPAGRLAAKVLGTLAGVANVDVQPDRVIVRFERTAPASAAFGDQVQIALGEGPVRTSSP